MADLASERNPALPAKRGEMLGHRIHGFPPRNGDATPLGPQSLGGKFGRIFGNLPGLGPSAETLDAVRKLAAKMIEPPPPVGQGDDPAGDNRGVPAGYTYLGQFIDHDITFDTTTLHETLVDPGAMENFRTPMLDLDSLYGAGPSADPYLFQRSPDTDMFVLGRTNATPGRGDARVRVALPFDLPRAGQGLAIIADPRNDENLIVAQLHLFFMRLHNKVVQALKNGTLPRTAPIRKTIFEEARELVIWHYQWIVLHDFLPKILDQGQLQQVLTGGRRFFTFGKHQRAFLPVEFSAAAYRLGHSMVRAVYDYNRIFTFKRGGVAPASLELLFQFSGRSGNSVPIPSDWIVDWRRFFRIDDKISPASSRKLNPFLAAPLASIPNVPSPNALAERNLVRGLSLALPTGQSVAAYMGLEAIGSNEIATAGEDGRVAAEHNFHIESPLWYYTLKEAELRGKGERLGQVGSRIVAEVFVGLLEADGDSFLNRNPGWKPTLPAAAHEPFSMGDLLRFAGDVAPVDDKANLNP